MTDFEREDLELAAVMGDRFTDVTAQANEKQVTTRKPIDTIYTEKTAQEAAKKPTKENESFSDAQLQPVNSKPNQMDKLAECAKCCLIFGGLNMLIFYWQQAGLMAESISVPCMWVCCVLAGFGIGKVIGRK